MDRAAFWRPEYHRQEHNPGSRLLLSGPDPSRRPVILVGGGPSVPRAIRPLRSQQVEGLSAVEVGAGPRGADLLGVDDQLLQRGRTIGGHQRGVCCIASDADEDLSLAEDVVTRVEVVPAVADPHLQAWKSIGVLSGVQSMSGK